MGKQKSGPGKSFRLSPKRHPNKEVEKVQTAQEEVQPSIEELTALNEQLRHRNMELSQTANDLTGMLNAVEIPIRDPRKRPADPAVYRGSGKVA